MVLIMSVLPMLPSCQRTHQRFVPYVCVICVPSSHIDRQHQTEDSLFNVARLKEARGGDERIFSLRTAVQAANDEASSAKDNLDNSNRVSAAKTATTVAKQLSVGRRKFIV